MVNIMANLSQLERLELAKLIDAAKRIKSLLEKNGDSVRDVIWGEIELSAPSDEQLTLKSFMDFSKGSFDDIETIIHSSYLLEDHFRPRG